MKLILIVTVALTLALVRVFTLTPTPQKSNVQAYDACQKFVQPIEVACVPNGVQKTVDGKTLQGN